MRSLFTLCALALVAGGAAAAEPEPQKFFLVDGKVTTESRVTDLEKEVAALKAEVAALKGQKTAAKSGCPNCTACGDACKCFGGGYYCAEGKCSPASPLSFGAPAPASGDGLPAYLSINGLTHERRSDGKYYPLAGPACSGPGCAMPSYPAFGGTFAAPSCSGPNCKIP